MSEEISGIKGLGTERNRSCPFSLQRASFTGADCDLHQEDAQSRASQSHEVNSSFFLLSPGLRSVSGDTLKGLIS